MASARIDVDAYAEGVLAGDRATLARAITLLESRRPEHADSAQRLLARLLPHSGGSHRVGVSGVPGVGKSTFVDSLGMLLLEQGHRVGVLAVDPSSARGGGSILGDKTRMARLSAEPEAFIRPSPSAGTPGGVARATREAIVLLEAAGFGVVLVETVGVGQSEVAVAGMVDGFLLLSLARTGDQLQGIKRGVLELADVVAVNKADGPHEAEARTAARELSRALRLLRPGDEVWRPRVLTCSGREGQGLPEVWAALAEHRRALEDAGVLAERRGRQQVEWMWAAVREQMLERLQHHPEVRERTPELEKEVRSGRLPATAAARRLLAAMEEPG